MRGEDTTVNISKIVVNIIRSRAKGKMNVDFKNDFQIDTFVHCVLYIQSSNKHQEFWSMCNGNVSVHDCLIQYYMD